MVQWSLCHGFTFQASSESPSASGLKPAARNWSAVICPGNLSSTAYDELVHAIVTANSKAIGKWRCIVPITVDFSIMSWAAVRQTGDPEIPGAPLPTVLWSHDFRHAGNGDCVAAIAVHFDGSRRIPFL